MAIFSKIVFPLLLTWNLKTLFPKTSDEERIKNALIKSISDLDWILKSYQGRIILLVIVI